MSSSKFFPWDAIHHFPIELRELKPGFFCFLSPDPFLQKIFLNLINPQKKLESEFNVVQASELNTDWFDSNLSTFSLFQSKSVYLIQDSEKLNKACIEYLSRENLETDSSTFIFLFLKKNDVFKKLNVLNGMSTFEVEAPRFWEGKKLLNFLSDVMGISLSYEVQTYILEKVENSSENFLNILKNIVLLFPQSKQLTIGMLKDIIQPDKLDKFLLATMLGNKEQRDFYETLLPFGEDYELLRESFAFLQTHFLKLADISYLDKKARLTKYDQQIKQQSVYFSHEEVEETIEWLSMMEIESKKKSPFIKHELQRRLLLTF